MNNKITKYIISEMGKLDKTGFNSKLYKEMFDNFTKEEFEEWHTLLKNGEIRISAIETGGNLQLKNMHKILDAKGIKRFHKLTEIEDGEEFQSKVDTYVMYLPMRKVKQTVEKGRSMGRDTKVRDVTTGAVTGDSAAGKTSFDEVKVLSGLGIKHMIDELFKIRGGDVGAERAMVELSKYGVPNMADIAKYGTGVQSVATFKQLMLSAGLKFEF